MISYLNFVLAILALGVSVLGSPQDEWTFPSLPDYSSSVSDGETHTFSWSPKFQTYFKEFCPKCDPENVAVWLTGGGGSTFTKHQVSCKLVRRNNSRAKANINTASIDVVNSRSFVWTVNASGPAEIVYWVLRFTAPGDYVDGQPEVSSPMFKIKRSPSKSTSTSINSSPSATRTTVVGTTAVGTTAVGTPILVSITSSSASEATHSSSDIATDAARAVVDDVKSKLTTPQIIGIAAGATGVFLIVLVSLAVCCYRRRRSRVRSPQTQHSHELTHDWNVRNPQLAPPAAVHTMSTHPMLSGPHAPTHMFSTSLTGSHASNDDSRKFSEHPSGSYDVKRANDSNTSLIPAGDRAPQDERSFREPTMRHAATEHRNSVRKFSDTSPGSNGAPAQGMSENNVLDALRDGRFSMNMKKFLSD
jgi:hypothetical protein